MRKFLLNLLAACILLCAPTAIPFSSAIADAPKKAGHFKARHFNKKDHLKFKKVKKSKTKHKKSKTRPERKLQRYDKKKMHSGEAKAGIFGIPLKSKGYKPQRYER
jgi:hypothetical protein